MRCYRRLSGPFAPERLGLECFPVHPIHPVISPCGSDMSLDIALREKPLRNLNILLPHGVAVLLF